MGFSLTYSCLSLRCVWPLIWMWRMWASVPILPWALELPPLQSSCAALCASRLAYHNVPLPFLVRLPLFLPVSPCVLPPAALSCRPPRCSWGPGWPEGFYLGRDCGTQGTASWAGPSSTSPGSAGKSCGCNSAPRGRWKSHSTRGTAGHPQGMKGWKPSLSREINQGRTGESQALVEVMQQPERFHFCSPADFLICVQSIAALFLI